ncbi:MAG: hypothetical protein EBU93_07340, partial [Chlamydiae bacterium]|nr:hypothetical protein [Chlamydiota bacterium]
SFFISLFPFLSVTINPASSALNVERFYGLMEFVSFDDLEMSTLTTLSLLVEIARSEITLAQANKIVAILLDMMKKAVDLDKVKLKNFDTWTLTVQALFIYITRNPAIQLPGNEEKTMTIVYNFYSVFARTLPNGYDNIFRLIKKSSTLEALCRNMIEQNEFLPKIIFELPVTLEAKAANKIQLNYADMISKMTFDFVEHEYFNAFIHWIATGKANFDAVMRLLNIIKPQTHFNVVFICFRVIETLLACPLYSGAQKQEALRKIFNDTNANFIIDLLSCKNAFEIDYIMTALSSESNYPHITHVIEGFKTTSWYPALRAEVERAKILNSEENSIKNLANLDFIADGLFKKTIIDFKSYIPNYFLKRVTFYGIKSLIETVSFGPSLLLKGR